MSNNVQIPAGLQVSSGTPSRVSRKPSHSFHLKHQPFQIQPFMIAPVLAGESMQNLLLQARCVSAPVRNRLIGWWMEHYFFYVKLTDMADRDDIKEMLVAMGTSVDTDAVADVQHYHYSGVNWLSMAMDRIVEEYFRDEGDTLATEIDGLYAAQINSKSWLDSVYTETELPADTFDATTNPADLDLFEKAQLTWEYMRNQGLSQMTFEEYCAMFGVRGAVEEEPHRPELIRFVRNWQYPSNTIDPTDGSATSAVSWSVAERADKKRFFKEPGFLIGVTVARPKVYLSNQRESASHLLDDAFSWLPATMKDDVSSSIKRVTQATGPLGGLHAADDYWVDVRDLFIYGDQFVNFALSATDQGLVALPVTTHPLSRYPTAAMVDALWAGTDHEDFVEQDGIVNLDILGTQKDFT